MSTRMMSTRERGWPLAVTAAILSAIPVTVGLLRLIQLAGGPGLIPADERFAGLPIALVVHIVAATTYAVGGIPQLLPRFRRRHLTWHRRAGRVLAFCGLLVAGSALWMTVGYAAQPGTGPLLFVFRLLAGSAMISCLVLGVLAVRRRRVAAHRAWMIRAYAIGLAAGTQAFTRGIAEALAGGGVLVGDLATAAGWVINLAIAELIIRRSGHPRRPRPGATRPVRQTVGALP
jgi:uncharacterized membrane protein